MYFVPLTLLLDRFCGLIFCIIFLRALGCGLQMFGRFTDPPGQPLIINIGHIQNASATSRPWASVAKI